MAITDDDESCPVVTFSQSLSPELTINELKSTRGSMADSCVLQADGAVGFNYTELTSRQSSATPALHYHSSSHLFPTRNLQTDSTSCPSPAVSTHHNNLPHRSVLYPNGVSAFSMAASVKPASVLRHSGVESENMRWNVPAASLATAGSTVRPNSIARSDVGAAIFTGSVPFIAEPSLSTARNISMLPANNQRKNNNISQRRNNNISLLTDQPNNNVAVHTPGPRFGVDAFMSKREVIEVLEMGFDVEAVRNVVHLRVVETGENYETTAELVDAVLAYNAVAAIDLVDTGSPLGQLQHQQQRQPRRETTNSQRSSPNTNRLDIQASSRSESVNGVDVSPSNRSSDANTTAMNQTNHTPSPSSHSAGSRRGNVADSVIAASSVSTATPTVNNALNATVNGAGLTSDAAAAVGSSTAKKSAKKKSKRKNKRTVNSNVTGSTSSVASTTTTTTSTTTAQSAPSQPPTTGDETVVVPWLIEQENKRLKSAKICKICTEAEVKVVFVPCGHIVCCDGCSSLTSKCPACQTPVKQAVKVFFS